jgi:hypothetical protein
MRRVDGSLARTLDFGDTPTTTAFFIRSVRGRLATQPRLPRGPEKYKALDHRRRQAQIRARRLLEG